MIIINSKTLTPWNIYENQKEAEKALPEVKNKNPDQEMQIVGFEEYKEKQREEYLTPTVQITHEQYWKALECLPPENWRTDEVPETFRMCEYYTSSFTNQYGAYKGTYIQKMIDTTDSRSWITLEDFKNFKPLSGDTE